LAASSNLASPVERVACRHSTFGLLVATPQAKLIDNEFCAAGRRILLSQKANLHILAAILIESDPMNLEKTSLLCPLSLSQLKELFPYVCLL